MGYTTEHHVERCLRDAKILTLAGGPNERHEDTLAEAVISKRGESAPLLGASSEGLQFSLTVRSIIRGADPPR